VQYFPHEDILIRDLFKPFAQKVYKIVPIMGTIMRSKEENMLELFFENPTKEWHFEEIAKYAKITRGKANDWLKQFIREGLIRRVKTKGKMPHYLSNFQAPAYQNRKRLFALERLYTSGLLNHLSSLKGARTIILFGSFARTDWYKNSDIDIFIYGDPAGLSLAKYEMILHREIQLFIAKSEEELRKFSGNLIRNIIKGNLIKGNLDFIKVEINA
jgi:predicted nucleotidyltransferase